MSDQLLQMKYHPAKKEVEFRRFQSGKEVPIRSDSKLTKYMNKKGQFVFVNWKKWNKVPKHIKKKLWDKQEKH